MASILQGDSNQFDQENLTSRNVSDKSQDTYKKLQLAELAAAEDKHKRLLKRLKHGGHDTHNLELKFNEYKMKILSNTNPEMVTKNMNTNSDMVNPPANNNRNFTSMSNRIEAKLEGEKKKIGKRAETR